MKNLAELLNDAVTVECVKRYRYNHLAPAVVKRLDQQEVQFDWWVTKVFLNGVPLQDWCDAFDIHDSWLKILERPFKSKVQAKRTHVEVFEDCLERFAPYGDGCDSEEELEHWARVIASLTK